MAGLQRLASELKENEVVVASMTREDACRRGDVMQSAEHPGAPSHPYVFLSYRLWTHKT
jgi:hypothetical protein